MAWLQGGTISIRFFGGFYWSSPYKIFGIKEIMPNLPAELVVVAKEADYVKLPYVLGAADRHIADLTAIHLITPTPVTLKPLPRLPLFYHLDHEVLPYDRKQLKYRRSWIFQGRSRRARHARGVDGTPAQRD